jgi:TIR domain
MKVFLSYRRDDTGGRAGRLFDVFVSRFGARNVFQDVNAVAPGLDFHAQIEAAIAASDAVLVVIGPGWDGGVDHEGRRRIDQPDDLVRQEVSKALTTGARVVPVLVDGATLPAAGDLPDDVASLVLRQAVTLRDASWSADVQELIRRLEDDGRHPADRRRWLITLVVGLVALATVVTVAVIARRGGQGPPSGPGADGSVASTAPVSLPTSLAFASTADDTIVCGPGGQVAFSAGPVSQDGSLLTTDLIASAHGLQTDTQFDSIRAVDESGRPYEGPDGGGAFDLDQDGGVTMRSFHLSVNRDEQAHAGARGIVLVISGECSHDLVYLALAVPEG